MKTNIRLLIVLIATLLFYKNHAIAQFTFRTSYSSPMTATFPKGIINTADGGYLIYADYAPLNLNQSALIIKTTATGDTLWTKILTSTNTALYPIVTDAIELPNAQGYMLIGHYVDPFNPFVPSSALLLKIDANGNLQLTKQFDCITPQGLYWFKSGCMSYDGNLLLLGIMGTYFTPLSSVIMKISTSGNVLWTKNISGFAEWDENPQAILEMPDHSIVIVRDTITQPLNRNLEIMKFDSNGLLLYAEYFNTVHPQLNPFSMTLGTCNSLLITGYLVSDSMLYKGFMMSVDSIGNLLWFREYGNWTNDLVLIRKAITLNNGNIVAITGIDDTIILFTTDANGNVIWTKGIHMNNGTANLAANDFVVSNDGGFAIVGRYNGDAQLFKTNANGNLQCDSTSVTLFSSYDTINTTARTSLVTNISIPDSVPLFVQSQGLDVNTFCFTTGINDVSNVDEDVDVYPNPFDDNLIIENNSNELSEIIIYDIDSRKILQKKFSGSIRLNTEPLAKGFYVYEVLCGSELCKKGKIVKN